MLISGYFFVVNQQQAQYRMSTNHYRFYKCHNGKWTLGLTCCRDNEFFKPCKFLKPIEKRTFIVCKKKKKRNAISKPTEESITKYSGFVAISPFSISGATFCFSAIQTKENSIQPVQIKIPDNRPNRVAMPFFSLILNPHTKRRNPINPIPAAPISLLCS
jgi:hypothetical protein